MHASLESLFAESSVQKYDANNSITPKAMADFGIALV